MEIIEYQIQQGDTLESIAEKHSITVEELVDFHNQYCGITQQILGDKIPINVNFIFLRNKEIITEKEKFLEQIGKFRERKARYRTKQINIVKINDVISAHSTIKSEYLVIFETSNNVRIIIEDSIYDFFTKGSEHLESFARASDLVKKEMVFEVDDFGKVVSIKNMEDLQQNWDRFKKQLPLNKVFTDSKAEIINQIIKVGNVEFASEKLLIDAWNRNLFNYMFFGQYLVNDLKVFNTELFETQSHFFPQIKFKVNCDTKEISKTEEKTNYFKNGKPQYVDIDTMISLYEKYYKKQVEYRFTEYLYDYEQYFTVSNDNKLIEEGSIRINERIKNNIQSEVLYEIKRVEL